MDSIRSRNVLVSLPQDPKLVIAAMACVLCQRIPDPKQYFICPGNGRHICLACARKYSDDPGSIKLDKGPVLLLETLLKFSKWECKFKKEGCDAVVLGSEWSSHVRGCGFKVSYPCKFPKCNANVASVSKLVAHYSDIHVMKMYEGLDIMITTSFETFEDQQGFALINRETGFNLLALEICNDAVFIWLWDMQRFHDKDGNETPATGCRITLSSVFSNKYGIDSQVHFVGSCVPYKITSKEVIDNVSVLCLPLSQLKKRYIRDVLGTRSLSISIEFSATDEIAEGNGEDQG
ncbi:unnamed protein product [Orchesella dallaii]|uniref:C2H2-type domain-containing protein n=1 Tax=Orchesella dallaii TaxID=48710 RepID=A0ABP1QD75_9HEXA